MDKHIYAAKIIKNTQLRKKKRRKTEVQLLKFIENPKYDYSSLGYSQTIIGFVYKNVSTVYCFENRLEKPCENNSFKK